MNEIIKYQIFRDFIFPIMVIAFLIIIPNFISFIKVHKRVKKIRNNDENIDLINDLEDEIKK